METMKFLFLEDINEYLHTRVGIQYLHAGLYEAIHKKFKEADKISSMRHGSSMREAWLEDVLRAL